MPDKRTIQAAFDAAAESYDAAAVLQREVADRMLERLSIINLAPQSMLDAGCGTGTLTLLIKQAHPGVTVHGLDIDAGILRIAQRKAAQAGQNILWQQGTATCLPYPDQSVDHVVASLLLHHLAQQDKQHMLREAFRVLKPGGALQVADFGRPHDFSMWLISGLMRWFEEIHDNVLGLLPVFMTDAGFHPVETLANHRTIAGTIALYRAVKPIR